MKIKPSQLRLLYRLKDFWPLVIAVPIGVGYLNFNIYCSVHNVGHVPIDLPIIVGVGLYYLIMAFLICSNMLGKRASIKFESLILFAFLFIKGLTIGWIITLSIYLLAIFILKRFSSPKTLRKKTIRLYCKYSPITLSYALMLFCTIFYSAEFFFYILFINIPLLFKAFIKNEVTFKIILSSGLLVIAFPFLLFFGSGTSFFGLGKQHVLIETTDNQSKKGYIFLESPEYIYFQADSMSFQPSITEKIPTDHIHSIYININSTDLINDPYFNVVSQQ